MTAHCEWCPERTFTDPRHAENAPADRSQRGRGGVRGVGSGGVVPDVSGEDGGDVPGFGVAGGEGSGGGVVEDAPDDGHGADQMFGSIVSDPRMRLLFHTRPVPPAGSPAPSPALSAERCVTGTDELVAVRS